MSMADTHHVGTRLENACVNCPLVRRSILPAEIPAVEIKHDQSLQRGASGAHRGDRDKRFGSGHAYADVAEPVSDAFMIENMAAIDHFLLELSKVFGVARRS